MYILYGRSLQSELSQNLPKGQAHQVFSTQGAASQTRALPALSSDGSVEAIITALSPLADLIGTCPNTNTRHFASQSVMTLGLPLSLRYWTNLLDRKVLKKCNDFSDLEQTIRRFMLEQLRLMWAHGENSIEAHLWKIARALTAQFSMLLMRPNPD